MNKDQVKGKVDEVAGRAKRQAGEWTGDGESQVEGAAQEVKGKVRKLGVMPKEAVATRRTRPLLSTKQRRKLSASARKM